MPGTPSSLVVLLLTTIINSKSRGAHIFGILMVLSLREIQKTAKTKQTNNPQTRAWPISFSRGLHDTWEEMVVQMTTQIWYCDCGSCSGKNYVGLWVCVRDRWPLTRQVRGVSLVRDTEGKSWRLKREVSQRRASHRRDSRQQARQRAQRTKKGHPASQGQGGSYVTWKRGRDQDTDSTLSQFILFFSKRYQNSLERHSTRG